MRYVILRDDDTNAFTPVECLDRLYRPFLDAGLPVNLAVIPDVATDANMANGQPEGFLAYKNGAADRTRPIASNPPLVEYLLQNPGYHTLQHGCHHDWLEFDSAAPNEISRRLQHGTARLIEAGFHRPQTFVAPYDKLSRSSLKAVAGQFRVLSGGWYELRRLPLSWWPKYLVKKARGSPHWRVGKILLLSHPGCLLSCYRSRDTILEQIIQCLNTQQLTVLVTHWWEYFRDQTADEKFIELLHQTAAYLAGHPQIRVISFDDLATGNFRWR